MTFATYFWRNDKVEILDRLIFVEDLNQSSMLKYLYCPAVLLRGPGKQTWCGYFAEGENFKKYWEATWAFQLPDEFRLSLLIMGVTL